MRWGKPGTVRPARASRLARTLRQHREWRVLVAAVLVLTAMAGTVGWTLEKGQVPLTGPPPGTTAWRADRVSGMPLPDPVRDPPSTATEFFASLSEAKARALARRHPGVVGNLDGAPVSLRYEANARALRLGYSEQRARSVDPAVPPADRARARELAARYSALLTPGRQILAFDPRGRGQLAEVHGDLGRARHVSVIVPGSDNDLSTFDRSRDAYSTPSGMARSLHRAAGDDIAVIAWVGYTTPTGLGPDAATARLAAAGAPRLNRFVTALPTVDGAPRPVVFCHSYGSVVCGLAASGLAASELVVLGSPGLRASSVADLRTRARVWAARDDSDWIRKVPNVEFLGLGHGRDPVDPAFGALRVPTGQVKGHTGYFAPHTESLRAFAEIATGSGTVAGHPPADGEAR
ncbi:alpha/beta hydrolase [Streptomyces sp. NPDC127068]|uniref:alpha/beta hydrolase n=1 Tax=Streptomyces sp. NPDC127068 TaxID=3347127 RepID=UPI003665FF24